MNGRIEIISGTLGGGKTAKAVEIMLGHLASGGYVFSNVEIYPDKVAEKLKSRFGVKWDPSRYVFLTGDARDYHTQVKRGTAQQVVMLVVDEAGLDLNARDWSKTDKHLIAFNAMARKLDIHLVYISQDSNDIDKQVRKKADTIWHCRNLRRYKIFGLWDCPVPMFFRVRYDNARGGQTAVRQDFEVTWWPWSIGTYNSDALVGSVAAQWNGMQVANGAPLERAKAGNVLNKYEIGLVWALASYVLMKW